MLSSIGLHTPREHPLEIGAADRSHRARQLHAAGRCRKLPT
jgi:hypothetical protein